MLVGAAYFAVGLLGLELAFIGERISPLWPASGVSFAAMWIFGRRVWPGVLAGSYAVTLFAGASALAALGPALGNVVEPLIGVTVLRRVLGDRADFERLPAVLAFLLWGATVGPLASATVGVGTLTLFGVVPTAQALRAWLVWWLGNGIGVLTVAPALIAWGGARPSPRAPWISLQLAALAAVSLVLSLIGFSTRYGFPYLAFPAVVWGALRHGLRGASLAVVIVSGAGAWFTAQGDGPLWTGEYGVSLWLVYTFIATIAVSGLVFAAIIAERERARESLADASQRHQALVEAAPTVMYGTDLEGRVTAWNAAAERFFGYASGEVLGRQVPIVPEEERLPTAELVEAVRRGEEVRGVAVRRRLKDGVVAEVMISMSPVYDARGELSGSMTVLLDATELERAERDLRRRDAILEAVSFCSQQFLRTESLDAAIDAGLARLGRAAGVSRAYVFQMHPDETDSVVASQRFEWAAPGMEPQLDNPELQNVPFRAAGFGRWEDRLSVGESVFGLVRDFPEDERKILEPQGIRSIAIMPIMVGGRWWGFMGFDDCLEDRFWTRAELGVLRTAADVFGAALERKEVEALLEVTEQRYRRVIELASEVFFATDRHGRITSLNPAFEAMTGFRSQDWLGRPFLPLLDQQHFEEAQLYFGRVIAGEQVPVARYRLLGAGGRVRVVEVSSSALREGAAVVGSWGVVRDVTERLEAEEAVRRTEERFRSLVENALDVIAVLDEEITLQYATPSAERLLGYPQAGLVGMKAQDLIHPEDLDKVAAEVQAGFGRHGVVYHAEFRLRRQDGEYVEFEAVGQVLTGESGAPMVVVNARDITERRRAERRDAALATLAERLSAASTHVEAARIVVEVAETLVQWDACRVDLYDAERDQLEAVLAMDLVEGTRQIVTSPYHGVRPGRVERRTLAEGPQLLLRGVGEKVPEDSGLLMFGDTSRRSASLMFVPIRHHDRAIGILALESYAPNAYTADDLAVLQRLSDHSGAALERIRVELNLLQTQAQLQQSQKMEAVGRLAGGVAHDFNNLLTTILATSDLLLQQLAGNETLREDVEEIRKAGLRAAELTRQLLAFGRKQVIAPSTIDLNALVRGVGTMLRRLIGEDIALLTDLEPGLGPVRCDQGQLEQVIINLAVNARDAMPDGGRLTIETRNVALPDPKGRMPPGLQPGPHVLLSVTDTGVGMDAETRRHIFEPFFTTKEKGKGTGLGLATVYGIVRQAGGDVEVVSAPGQGARFTVLLPRAELDEAEALSGVEDVPVHGSETVLLVEDEAAVRRLAERILGRHGYKILSAKSAEDALTVAHDYPGPIHLLLTDVIMTGDSGAKLARRLGPERPEMRVLFVSGYTDGAIAHHGVLDPGVAFLQKPFTPDALTTKVREVLDAPPGAG